MRPLVTSVLSVLLAAALLACGGGTTPPPADPIGAGGGTATPVEPVLDIGQLGAACGEDGSCAPGASCTRYFGIAGPSGPEFSSCEIACADDKTACPDGSSCVTIADGPGSVCRAAETAE